MVGPSSGSAFGAEELAADGGVVGIDELVVGSLSAAAGGPVVVPSELAADPGEVVAAAAPVPGVAPEVGAAAASVAAAGPRVVAGGTVEEGLDVVELGGAMAMWATCGSELEGTGVDVEDDGGPVPEDA